MAHRMNRRTTVVAIVSTLLLGLLAAAVVAQVFALAPLARQERAIQADAGAAASQPDTGAGTSMAQQQVLERNLVLPDAGATGVVPGLDGGEQQRLATFDQRDYDPIAGGSEDATDPCRRFVECDR